MNNLNLSSIIISTLPENTMALIEDFRTSKICEYHLHDKHGRIIVTIEEASIADEVIKLKQLQEHPLILDAVMHFSYSESELESAKDELKASENNIPDWLNNPNAKLKDIKYRGDLKGKF